MSDADNMPQVEQTCVITTMLKILFIQVSADHRRLAYAVDQTGEEQYNLFVKEMDTGELAQLTKLGTASGSMAWALDNSTLFYVTLVRASTFGHLPHAVHFTQRRIARASSMASHLQVGSGKDAHADGPDSEA